MFSCEIAHRGEGLVGGVFFLAGGGGGWALGYHSMGFGHFPNIS